MSFPRYPKYKDSGVEWLGQVPEHWDVKRIRFVAELNPSKSEVAKLDRETPVSFLPMEAIGDDGTLSLEKEKTIGELESGYTYFRNGDVTVAKITPCYENGKGAVMRGLRNGIGFGTTELIVARPKPAQVTGTYLHYLFISPDFRSIGESHMYGAGGQKRVPDDFVRNFATSFPPLPEQTAIATFLDRETAKIDALVAEQQRLMELLKEKRQAVITHAVTKGLNPKAPLKPSGIEWLGDIPTHWTAQALNRLVELGRRITYGIVQPGEPDPSGRYMIRGQDYSTGWAASETIFRVSDAIETPYRRARLAPGDLLMTIVGAGLGNIAIVPHWLDGANITQTTARIAIDPAKADSRFIAEVLRGPIGRRSVETFAKGAAQPGLNLGDIRTFPVTVPPLPEQRLIANYIEQETSQFDTLTAEAQRAIDLLQERRTALISAAVTGQIDVRNQ